MKVAVIGCGAMGKNHCRVYSKLDDVELVAACDASQKTAAEVASQFRAKAYTDYELMLEQEEIDALSICVPTKMHRDVALYCISQKKHVLVEKPIAATVMQAQEIIDAAKKNKVKLMVGHIERFNPVITELKKQLEKDDLGKVLKVHCERLSLFPQRIIDVGVIIDLAIHEIDILRYLIPSRIARVYAETAQRYHSDHEDLLIGTVRFENDVLGVISANWLTPKKVREITITCEKGMFVANYITQQLTFYEKEFAGTIVNYQKDFVRGKEGKKHEIDVRSEEPLKLELEHFIDCAKSNKEPKVSGKDGMEALMIAQKLLESARKNQVVKI